MDNINAVEYKRLVKISQNLDECLMYPFCNLLGDYDLDAIEEALKGVNASIEAYMKQTIKG